MQRPASGTGAGLVVRPERPEDFEAIGHVLKLAFGRVNEAELVERVRATPYYVPDLALVAEDDGDIVGHALWSYVELQTGEESLAVLALAPLAVRPDRQHEGVGVALVEAGLEAAAERREPIALVVGYPRYYGRFGFEPARDLGISPPSPEIPDDVFMVKRMPGYNGRPRGRVVYPPAFDGV